MATMTITARMKVAHPVAAAMDSAADVRNQEALHIMRPTDLVLARQATRVLKDRTKAITLAAAMEAAVHLRTGVTMYTHSINLATEAVVQPRTFMTVTL